MPLAQKITLTAYLPCVAMEQLTCVLVYTIFNRVALLRSSFQTEIAPKWMLVRLQEVDWSSAGLDLNKPLDEILHIADSDGDRMVTFEEFWRLVGAACSC